MATPPIRCLFILHDFAGGGAERVTLNLIRNLDRSRFVPAIFAFNGTGAFRDAVPEGVSVALGLARLLRAAWEADVIVGALEHRAVFAAAIAGLLCRKRAIGWI